MSNQTNKGANMLTMRVRGLGPHQDLRLSIGDGVTTIRGRSGSGKSTIMQAAALALWGTDSEGAPFDRGFISADKAGVSFDVAGRSVPTKGEHRRSVLVDGEAEPGGTEAQFLAALPAHYRDSVAARLVMFPTTLWALAGSAQGGLALRQVLDRMLPGQTAAELLADVPERFPRDPSKAALEVRNARKDHDAASAALLATQPIDPGAAPVEGADVQAAREAIAAFDAAVASQGEARAARRAWLDEQAAHAQATDRCAFWDRQRAALVEPPEPEPSPDAVKAAADDIDLQRVAYQTARVAQAARTQAVHAAAAWERAAARAPAVPEAGCPGATACQRIAEAQTARDAYLADLGPCPVVPPEVETVAEPDEAPWKAMQALLSAWAAYRVNLHRLGERPPEPAPLREEVPEPAPVPDVSAARHVVAVYERAVAMHADRVATFERTTKRRAEVEQDVAKACAWVERVEGWLERVRSAPGEAVAAKLALVTGGPLEVRDDDGRTEVLIHGRPWYLASHGERIAAVADWRIRLRGAAGLDALPVFVDDVSSVGGLPMPTAPRTVMLVTTDGDFEVMADGQAVAS